MTYEPQDEEPTLESLGLSGDLGSEDSSGVDVMTRVYRELRAVADRMMSGERPDHTLQPTALVHEAFLRLGDGSSMDRLAYLATAARVMRRVLIDHARGRNADKRGGQWKRVTMQGVRDGVGDKMEVDLLRLDEALADLAKLDPRQAQIVELRFFSGMTGQEIADHLEISRTTVVRELTMSRAWLQRALSRTD